ncbi:MAG: T9SS type A sorting domain-containing protein [Bacteroidales bacterium]
MIEILNLEGEILYKCRYTKRTNIHEIGINRFPRGVYFVKIQLKDCVETKKLFVS